MAATTNTRSVHAANGPERTENAPSPQVAVEVIALTARDDFLLELGECLEGSASIMPVESSALALAAAAKSRRVQVLVIDSRDLADLRAEVELLQSRAPALTALVFASQEAEVKVAAALKGSNVFAVLSLPIDARKTSAVFEGAVADAESRRSTSRAAGAEARSVTVHEYRPAAGADGTAIAAATAAPRQSPPQQESTGGGRTRGIALAGAACLVVAAAAAWFLTREDAPAPTDTTAPAPVSAGAAPDSGVEATPAQAPAEIQGDIDELLEKARVAMRERRYTEPANNSALLYYRSAAKADPGNAEALDGLTRVRPMIVERFDEMSKAGRHDEAAAALAQLQSALPADPSIPEMRLRLASARIAEAIEEGDAERATALVRSAQATTTVPAPQLAKWRSEITRLSEKAKQDKLAEQKSREKAAAEQKARNARAAEAERNAQLAREQESVKKLEAERAEQAKLAAAQSAEAAAKARAADAERVAPKLKRSFTPDYPNAALEKGLTGVVTVSYTVDVEGRTQDVRVESADPPGVFDKSATAAVKRWRYEPATVDGVPVDARLSITIRFSQPK